MATYTLFGGAGGGSLVSDTEALTIGVEFAVSAAEPLQAVRFYSASGAEDLPSAIALWTVSGGALVTSQAASWSGAAGSGWVEATFASPPGLSAAVNYVAGAFHGNTGVNWYSASPDYWDTGPGSGGISDGPLAAPSNSAAQHGQNVFDASGSLAFPGGSFRATCYWVDVVVGTPGGTSHSATAALAVTPSFSAGRARGRYRTARLAVVPAFSDARTVAHARHALLAVIPSFRALWAGGAAPAVQTGSWWGLDTVLKQSREEFQDYISRPPVACPVDGEPLRNAPATPSGSGVELYCPYCGWQYPRDWTPPSRPWP